MVREDRLVVVGARVPADQRPHVADIPAAVGHHVKRRARRALYDEHRAHRSRIDAVARDARVAASVQRQRPRDDQRAVPEVYLHSRRLR